MYTIFNTNKILGRSPSVMIGKASGLAGIAYWINDNYGLEGDEQVDKKSELVIRLKDWIDAEYAGGRQTSLSNDELEAKIEALSGGKYKRL